MYNLPNLFQNGHIITYLHWNVLDGEAMATSSIGETVKLNRETGRKMAESFKHLKELLKPNGTVKTGRIVKNSSIKFK